MDLELQRRAERLIEAREARYEETRDPRFASRATAARALNISYQTYDDHETGARSFHKQAHKYARFYKVDFEWLWAGVGTMNSHKPGQDIIDALDEETRREAMNYLKYLRDHSPRNPRPE